MKDVLKRLTNSRKVLENGAWLYALQIFNTLIPLLTLPYITRILGPTEYGTFSISLNLVGYFQVIIEYGFGMSATREIALLDSNDDEDAKHHAINTLFTSVLMSRVILTIGCLLFAMAYGLLQFDRGIQRLSFYVLTVGLVSYCLQVNWYFQGIQQMKYISITSVVGRTISTILIFLLIKQQDDLLTYCVLYSIAPLITSLSGILIMLCKYKIRTIKVTINQITEQLYHGWYVFTTTFSAKVFGSIGVTILGIVATEYDVGLFAAINKIPSALILIWAPISQILYPISSQRFNENTQIGASFIKKIRRIVLPLFALISLLLSFFSRLMIGIVFGEEYSSHSWWVIPLLCWFMLSVANNLTGTQTLLASGHDKEYSRCFQISVIATVLINFVLINAFQGNGAAIAPMLSELILSILLSFSVHRLGLI